ncbi:RNA-binding domain-containing protein [Phanerochaete sordida]|uniref:RNA-binding domain-containing protein n=1 Tax=Phanerochaete sordida TaxID=48140 RepID=A0A9P3G4Q1_9APHY|nr:RNA-binding domain-containing protein [Phanerochaete sordida]
MSLPLITNAARRLAAGASSSLTLARASNASRFRVSLAAASRYSTATQVLRAKARFGIAREQVEDDDDADMLDRLEQDPDTDRWVRFGTREERRTIIVRGFNPDTTTVADIKRMLEPYGEILQLNLHGRSVCYVEFAKLASARSVIYNHKSYPFRLDDVPLTVNYAVDLIEVGEPCRMLWVSGLDMSTRPNLEELKRMFEKYGEVENIILNRQGQPTCIVRYTTVAEAEAALQAHRERRLRYRGLALQLRFSNSKPAPTRQPNQQLHVMGFCGDEATLLSYIVEYASRVRHIYMTHPRGEHMERHDVFITFDSIQTATEAMDVLNGQLGLVAQYAWPKKQPQRHTSLLNHLA